MTVDSIWRSVKNSIFYFLIWLILSAADRLLFVLVYRKDIHWDTNWELVKIFLYGFKMDLSLASYVCALPAIVWLIGLFFRPKRIPRIFLDAYTYLFIFLFALISIVNINIYNEWGSKISRRVVTAFLETPKEALASTASSPVLLSTLGIVLIGLIGFVCYKFLVRRSPTNKLPLAFKFALLIFVPVVLFTCIRGGYGRATLNPSISYYSTHPINNHAAVNTHWAFFKELITRNVKKNPFLYFQEDKVDELLAPVFNISDSTTYFLRQDVEDINVVLIVLESFTADLVHALTGEKGITPNFEKWIKQGVLFDEVYAASDRSDKGIIAVFSAFPSQGDESIIKYIPKHEKLFGLPQVFEDLGYSNSFYYGGQSEFYNFKSYMLSHGMHRVVDQKDFKPSEVKSSWGVYDGLTFQRYLKDLNREPTPFFSSLFTLSNHEPFELDGVYKFGEKTNADKFKSTAYYTDSVINDFIEEAKKSSWYDNTLFVFIADHGHRLPASKWSVNNPERYHIPLLFYGNLIEEQWKGKRVSKIANQTDLAATLLHQMGLPSHDFPWSRNIMGNNYKPLAFFATKDVIGIHTDRQSISFDSSVGKISEVKNKTLTETENQELLDTLKAYYQKVYTQFLAY